MPKSRHCIPVSTTLTPEQDARLRARAALQRLSRAEVLRKLIAALPEPSPHQPPAARARPVPFRARRRTHRRRSRPSPLGAGRH
jgi:hypothetical protein